MHPWCEMISFRLTAAVKNTIGVPFNFELACMRAATSPPSMLGIITSSVMTAG